MASAHPLSALSLLLLTACGQGDAPEAPPGSVERTTDAIERNEAVQRNETIQRIDREAEMRAEASKQRVRAVEQEQAAAN